MTRLQGLADETFDVAIIGGGIVGCGVARDAARRGLRVALFEKHDFGSGTTAGSTRIVHGGLRYLETADFRLVRMDLRERETLLRIAKHLVRPLQFVIPLDTLGASQRFKLRIGLALYDGLARRSSLPRHRTSAHEVTYYDARVDSPERLCIENLTDAAEHGAQVFNYVEVIGVARDGARIAGVHVRDRFSEDEGIVRARITVNATGPWLTRMASRIDHALPGNIRTTKGIHLVCPALTNRALVLFSGVDGRLMFAIPRAGCTWLGTTDTDYDGDPSDATATPADVDYIVHSLRHAFPSLSVDDVLFTTAGVRALVMQPGRASRVSRLHRIVDGESAGQPGLISILGAKITGYRAIAEDATTLVCQRLGIERPSSTAEEPLPGARSTSASRLRWPHLYDLYGSRAPQVEALVQKDPELGRPLVPHSFDIGAQVIFAARHEYCLTVADFLRRRSLLGATADQGWGAAETVGCLLGHELGWSEDVRRREIDAYARDIARTVSFRSESTREIREITKSP